MIKHFPNIDERRSYRVEHCYSDTSFLKSYEVIKAERKSLRMEEVYASADDFRQFLVEKNIKDYDFIGMEINDLEEELGSKTDLLLILVVTYLKLCLSSKEEKAAKIAEGLKRYCFNTPSYAEQLALLPDIKRLFNYTFGGGIETEPAPTLPLSPYQGLTVHGNFIVTQQVQNQANGVSDSGTGIQQNQPT